MASSYSPSPGVAKKANKKSSRRSRGPGESPDTKQGHQWLPLASTQYLVPGHKMSAFQQLEGPLDTDTHTPLPGGVIKMVGGRSGLHAHWTPLEKLEIGQYLPVGSDSILIHPDTMRTCGCVISSFVMIRGRGKSDGDQCYVCEKVWPLQSLPLDVVGLGQNVVCGCGVSKESSVEVWPVTTPTPQLPIAAKVTLVPREKLGFSVEASFTNYLLHMYEGCLLTTSSCLSVQYLGERRVFKVQTIEALPDNTSHSNSNSKGNGSHGNGPGNSSHGDTLSSGGACEEMSQKLSDLSLNGSYIEEEVKGEDIPPPAPPAVYKVTARSTMSIMCESAGDDRPQCGPTLAEVGGLQKQVQLLRELVLFPLKSADRSGFLYPSGVLLHGPPGVGKSLIARALIGESSAHSVQLSAAQLLTQDSEVTLQRAFSEAIENSPSLLILDNLDSLCPREDGALGDTQRKALACLLAQLDLLQTCPPPGHVTVMATTNQIDRVMPSLRCQGRFEKEVEISVPSAKDRVEILGVLLRSRSHCLSVEQVKNVAERAHSYVGADLLAVCAEAQYKAQRRILEEGGGEERLSITYEDMLSALREVRPSAMKEVVLEVPKVLWADIGGQEEVKQSMKEAVEIPIKHPEMYIKMGIRAPRGVLLYGPPGCSKTMVARALATESGLNFIAVKGPELFSKWVGASEEAVRKVFSRARAAAPAIVFFDEIDALAVQRKNEGSSVADRVLAQLLTEMDGVESLGDVLVVAATNRPDMIDKALLRPGRIDELIYVPLPSSATRKEIFKIQFKKIPVDKDVSLENLMGATEGFSGAEVVSLCQKAARHALRSDMESCCVQWCHFEQALSTIFPQTSVDTVRYYDSFKRKQKNIFNQ